MASKSSPRIRLLKNTVNALTDKPDNQIKITLAAMRCPQWIKNGFVIAPLLFANRFTDPGDCFRTALAFISFCLLSSGIYIINDLRDLNEDRQHPIKRLRPIARGALSTSRAGVLSITLIALSILAGFFLGKLFLLTIILYAILNIAYSLGIKHIAIFDVMTIAAGFLLRIIGGAVAIDVEASHWLLLCTFMISVFLGFTKRRAELISRDTDQPTSRLVLKDYSIGFLDQVISMVTSLTIICYILYTIDDRTISVFGSRAMLLTVPSVMYGLFRYLYIIYHHQQGEDPTREVLRDIHTIVNLIIWLLIAAIVVVYGSRLNIFG